CLPSPESGGGERKNEAEMSTRRSIISRRIAAISCAAALALGLSARSHAQSSAPETVSAAIIGISVSIWPAIVADQKGFFAAEGVKVDFISAGASARSLQQVAAGSAEIGSSSMVDTIRGIGGGANVKIFLNTLAVPPPHP